MKQLTTEQICDGLENGGIEVTVKRDYPPSGDADKAAYQEIEFMERAWRQLLLVAANRARMSKQLDEGQNALDRKRRKSPTGDLRVRVLTIEAALHLQDAGYELESSQVRSLSSVK